MLSPDMPVLGDDYEQHGHLFEVQLDDDGNALGRGYQPRNWHDHPFGSTVAKPFDLEVIPRTEWDDRIADMAANKTRLSDLLDFYNVPPKNQRSTNYCWIFGPTRCCEIARLRQANQYVSLSPASCGAIIKNYQNVGGWGSEGLEFIRDRGVAPSSLWPDTAIQRQYDNAETREARKRHVVLEWTECRPRDLDQLMTLAFHRIPATAGYNWWRHQITILDPVKGPNGQYGVLIDNSWGESWGENGRGVLLGSKAVPDDCVAVRTITPS